ncbi:hypothetical protein L873DRAFT_1849584 [Choiromyces venosus 120613-1]|uniref:Uncharacterized protein n=1 Tax=Choiromyces venosus 120613-1 TaxID=1336337 RepID=A0A3N4ISQ9_9PEZI|nr:hypothetical protein L873DRAFT_1849584 [Choiromyces venosus 120613-1]
MKSFCVLSRFRHFNNFASCTTILCSNLYSTIPSYSPPPKQSLMPHDQRIYNFRAIEALIGCKFRSDGEPKRERRFAIRALEAAAKDVRKKRFGSLVNPNDAYVNTAGATILENIDTMRKEITQLQKHSVEKGKALEELRKQSEEKGKALEELRKQSEEKGKALEEKGRALGKALEEKGRALGKALEQLQKQQSITTEWAVTMQPLQETAIAIRRCFFQNYRKLIGQDSIGSPTAIPSGNKAAHNGDLITDTTLVMRGDITDTHIFHSLYGIFYNSAQPYLGTFPAATEIIVVY